MPKRDLSSRPPDNTYCSVLTPQGEGGISVIRVSGQDALDRVDSLFRGATGQPLSKAESGRLCFGRLVIDGEVIDEVFAVHRRPTLPTVEIQCHGGLISVRRIVEGLSSVGVIRLDKSTQSFAGLDLIQQEALTAVPEARSLRALNLLLSQYEGALSAFVKELAAAKKSTEEVEELVRPPRLGEVLCSPRRVVIAGPPNVGKSSLFNALLEEDRVITAEVPGTTRDAIEEEIVLDGIPFTVVDTAGIRESSHEVEQLSIEVSQREIDQADVVVFIFDRSVEPAQSVIKDFQVLWDSGKPTIPISNKCDLPDRSSESLGRLGLEMVETSAIKEEGIEDVTDRLLAAVAPPKEYQTGSPAIFTARQAKLFMDFLERDSEEAHLDVCGELLGRY